MTEVDLQPVVDYETLEPIPVVYGYATILTSVLFFRAINQLVASFVPSPVDAENTWKWRNLVISWIHAIIVGTWDLSCFYRYPELMTDLVAFHNIYLYTMVAFSTGYFIYDFIDIVVNKKLLAMWEVVPHHFAVAGMFFYNVVVSRCIAYNVVALLAEVNTIFLHTRKLLQMFRVPYSHWLYKLNSAINLVTFVTCRFSGCVWIVGGMFVWYHRVSHVYYVVLGSSMFVMWVTNLMLFWRLLSSDLIRPYCGSKSRLARRPSSTDSSVYSPSPTHSLSTSPVKKLPDPSAQNESTISYPAVNGKATGAMACHRRAENGLIVASGAGGNNNGELNGAALSVDKDHLL